ncbi:MAG TPA: hypothetical protein VFE26_10925 [Trebonia sp.]|jgi:hypothetical protein|nr:hypothetical protein [Trebonia sp.]
MSDIDTMRWGDTQTLEPLNAVTTDVNSQVVTSSQMLNAKWQRPVTWRLMLSVAPSIAGEDTASTLTVFVTLFVGVGQANAPVPLATLTFTDADGFAGQTVFFDIPAETMQVQFTAVFDPSVASTGSVVQVTAMCAPITEPRVMADVRELLREIHHRDLPSRHNAPSDGDGQPRWMGPGFDDGVMRYRR